VQRFVVSLSVIILELTGGLGYMTPVMIAIMFSKITGDLLHAMNMVDIMVELKGFPYVHADDVEEALLGDVVAGDLMHATDLTCLSAEKETLGSLRATLTKYHWHGFPVVDDARLLVGYVSRAQLQAAISSCDITTSSITRCVFVSCLSDEGKMPMHAPSEVKNLDNALLSPTNSSSSSSSSSAAAGNDVQWLHEFIDPYPVRVLPGAPAVRVLDMFKSLGLRYVMVASSSGKTLGIIKKKDLILARHNLASGVV
jgi:chloride channel 3/4/5